MGGVTQSRTSAVGPGSALPPTPVRLRQRSDPALRAKAGCVLQRLVSADRCKAVRSDNPSKAPCRGTSLAPKRVLALTAHDRTGRIERGQIEVKDGPREFEGHPQPDHEAGNAPEYGQHRCEFDRSEW